MNYHVIINMNDAIEIARTFRKEGFVWVRKHKGYWWLYDSNLLHQLIIKMNSFEPGITISIDQRNTIEPGQMIMIDKDKIRPPLQRRLKVEIDPPPLTVLGAFNHWRFGIYPFK